MDRELAWPRKRRAKSRRESRKAGAGHRTDSSPANRPAPFLNSPTHRRVQMFREEPFAGQTGDGLPVTGSTRGHVPPQAAVPACPADLEMQSCPPFKPPSAISQIDATERCSSCLGAEVCVPRCRPRAWAGSAGSRHDPSRPAPGYRVLNTLYCWFVCC